MIVWIETNYQLTWTHMCARTQRTAVLPRGYHQATLGAGGTTASLRVCDRCGLIGDFSFRFFRTISAIEQLALIGEE